MGFWGCSIDECDTFLEVTDLFFEDYKRGKNVNMIVDSIIDEYSDNPERHIAYLALANCLWQINMTNTKVNLKINEIKEKCIDNEFWQANGADEHTLIKRKKELEKFLNKLKENCSINKNQSIEFDSLNLKKGDIFWYKYLKRLYGAIVLDIQFDFYLVAISEQLLTVPKNVSEIMEAPVYTVAWFSENDILPPKKINMVSHIYKEDDFNFKAGAAFLTENGRLSKIIIKNCGQNETWAHRFCSLGLPDRKMKNVINPYGLPTMINLDV